MEQKEIGYRQRIASLEKSVTTPSTNKGLDSVEHDLRIHLEALRITQESLKNK